MHKTPTGPGFYLMKLGFKFRDIIKPRKNVVKEAGIKPGAAVLDFGCGPGGYILPTTRLTGPTGKIYALDISPLAIESVEALVSKKKLSNIKTIRSDGPTGLPDNSIDVVLLYDVLHHLNPLDNVLAELHRVLKPDGTLSMSDHHLEEAEIVSKMTGSGHFKLLSKGKRVYNFSKVLEEK
jgi:ubiquinone/menaquinone biosynthesis C-methylase UbiE